MEKEEGGGRDNQSTLKIMHKCAFSGHFPYLLKFWVLKKAVE